MEQKEITEPTIMLVNTCTAGEFEEDMANIREVIRLLLINSKPEWSINAQMIGRCFDTLDFIETLNVVDDWPKK